MPLPSSFLQIRQVNCDACLKRCFEHKYPSVEKYTTSRELFTIRNDRHTPINYFMNLEINLVCKTFYLSLTKMSGILHTIALTCIYSLTPGIKSRPMVQLSEITITEKYRKCILYCFLSTLGLPIITYLSLLRSGVH